MKFLPIYLENSICQNPSVDRGAVLTDAEGCFFGRGRPRSEFLKLTEAEGGREVLFWPRPRSITDLHYWNPCFSSMETLPDSVKEVGVTGVVSYAINEGLTKVRVSNPTLSGGLVN